MSLRGSSTLHYALLTINPLKIIYCQSNKKRRTETMTAFSCHVKKQNNQSLQSLLATKKTELWFIETFQFFEDTNNKSTF